MDTNNTNQKNKLPRILCIVGAVIVIIIVVASYISRLPDDNVQFNDGEDERLSIMSEEKWAEAEAEAEYYGRTEASGNWKNLFYRDEFGEEDLSQPYLQANVNGYIYYGQSTDGDYRNLIITINPQFGIELSETGTIGSAFNGDDNVLVKDKNGIVERILVIYHDGCLYIQSPDVIQKFIDIMEDGNFTLAISGDGRLASRRWNFMVADQLRGIKTALRVFRDIPNIENIFGRIN